jgi:hypothetical protein
LIRLGAIQLPGWLVGMFGALGITAAGAYFGSTTSLNAGEDERARQFDVMTGGNGIPKENRNWWQRNMPSWLGGKAAPLPSGDRMKNARESYDFWISKGLTPAQAAGMVANEGAESNFNPGAVGDGGAGRGLFQHHPDRQADILRGSGVDMASASHADQLRGAYWELSQGKFQHVWEAVQQAKTPEEAAAIISRMYEMPRDAAGQAAARAASAGKLFNFFGAAGPNAPAAPSSLGFSPGSFAPPSFTAPPLGAGGGDQSWNSTNYNPVQNVSINVTGSDDASSIAHAINRDLTRNYANLVRNLGPQIA